MPTKFIAYRRVSTAKQGSSGLGLDAQERAIEKHASINDGVIIQTYTEVETGKKDTLENRPQLIKALAHAKRAKATLVIAKLDRLSRSVYVTAELHKAGVDFVCCDMPHANRMTVQLMAVMAEDEVKRISARTRDALAEYRERKYVSKRIKLLHPEGVPPEVVEATAGKLGSSLPQCRGNLNQAGRVKGARAAGLANKALADGAYGDVVQDILDWRAEGLSQRQIAAKLNAEGKRTRRDRPWNQVQVMRVLARSKPPGG